MAGTISGPNPSTSRLNLGAYAVIGGHDYLLCGFDVLIGGGSSWQARCSFGADFRGAAYLTLLELRFTAYDGVTFTTFDTLTMSSGEFGWDPTGGIANLIRVNSVDVAAIKDAVIGVYSSP